MDEKEVNQLLAEHHKLLVHTASFPLFSIWNHRSTLKYNHVGCFRKQNLFFHKNLRKINIFWNMDRSMLIRYVKENLKRKSLKKGNFLKKNVPFGTSKSRFFQLIFAIYLLFSENFHGRENLQKFLHKYSKAFQWIVHFFNMSEKFKINRELKTTVFHCKNVHVTFGFYQ